MQKRCFLRVGGRCLTYKVAHGHTGSDSTTDSSNACIAEVCLGEVQVVTDDWQQRCWGKGGHEGGKEGQPAEVEGGKVWP